MFGEPSPSLRQGRVASASFVPPVVYIVHRAYLERKSNVRAPGRFFRLMKKFFSAPALAEHKKRTADSRRTGNSCGYPGTRLSRRFLGQVQQRYGMMRCRCLTKPRDGGNRERLGVVQATRQFEVAKDQPTPFVRQIELSRENTGNAFPFSDA
jgi:hypothetical protein